MYQVIVEQDFDAAHALRGYRGKCENIHGHRFRVVAAVELRKLDEVGMAYDFSEMKRHLREIVDKFDHTCLNDLDPFQQQNPSSENIAAAIYRELQGHLGAIPLAFVEVWESPQSGIRYSPEP